VIKKLRIRMILSAILAFSLVILFVSVLVNVVNYRIVTRQADETLISITDFESQRIMDKGDKINEPQPMPPMPSFMGKTNPEAEFTTRFFIAEYDDDGNIINVSTDNITTSVQVAEQLAKEAVFKKSRCGYIREYRYMKSRSGSMNIVVFLNVMQEQQHLRVMRLITLTVALMSLIIVSILVIIFSGTAIRPIASNIERQKQFITDASHELKTPLTSIVTSLDVLTMENGDDEWTENIRNQTSRMSKLVGELVTLSRLDEAKPIYSKETFSISDLSWEIVEIYQSRAKAIGRVINTEIMENLLLSGDKSAIGQMISVLLDNAIKYAKGDGDTVFKVAGAHNKVIIEVSNPAEFEEGVDVNRLFDRFYRPDSSRNSDSGGSGIGLAIAKAVVTAHGGEITAECPDNKRMIIKVKL